jgi:DNA polymerase (family 10)
VLGQRDPFEIDMEQVIACAARLGVALELNAYPQRLDLDANRCRQAKEAGVAIAISTDAHAASQMGRREFGVFTARRGWLEANDVLNAGPVSVISDRRQARLRKR